MKVPSYTLRLQDKVTFEQALTVGSFVVFYSTSLDLLPDGELKANEIDNTSFNILTADGDYLLHISIRRKENAVVFNSRTSSGSWGDEERIALQGIYDSQQTKAAVAVRIHEATFAIYFDGKLTKTYKKRISKDAQGAAYACNRKSVFSDPVTVAVANELDPLPPASGPPARSYQELYFKTEASKIAEESKARPYDFVIIGSGIGGGVLAADLLDKNRRLLASRSNFAFQAIGRTMPMALNNRRMVEANIKDGDDRSLRILVIERGGLTFNTHSLNMPRPTSRGTYGQMNDLFYHAFRDKWDMDQEEDVNWDGGPVYCLGGRSTVWGLFSPRISDDTFKAQFPKEVYDDLNKKYLRKAEDIMNISYPQTLPLHRALIDKLNLWDSDLNLPKTQWEWGRVASEFRNEKNFDFAEGAYSTVDRLIEAAMDDATTRDGGKFQILLESPVDRLEPPPKVGTTQSVSHVVVKDASGGEHKISCKSAVVCAGSVESPAILLRSAGKTPLQTAYGKDFVKDFGHVTDHYIFYVTLPFFYRDMAKKDALGGMKLQTDISFNTSDNTTALANISLDAGSFLPRRNVPDSDLPQFIVAYILPSQLERENSIKLKDGKPFMDIKYADVHELEKKKKVLLDFAVSVMNKTAEALDLQFVKHDTSDGDYLPIKTVTAESLGNKLGVLGYGGVAHEMGSIPMPNQAGKQGVVDSNLKMKSGWNNVYVCDLSVFPYSPAANPTLSLAALSLRLSDRLLGEDKTLYQPIVVYNLLESSVYVTMTRSRSQSAAFGPAPDTRVEIRTGKSECWKRETKETISVYACACSKDFNVQLVEPGRNALIVAPPPKASGCTCAKK